VNINDLNSAYYRYNLRDALRNRLTGGQGQGAPPRPIHGFVVHDEVSHQSLLANIRAPQGAGEYKHAPLDEKPAPEINENNINVKQKAQPQPNNPPDYAYHYRVHSTLDVSEVRRKMENHVRIAKRAGKGCPFFDAERGCTRISIRCGDRVQYSNREDVRQITRKHGCAYIPGARQGNVLIVDDNPEMREFCKSSFALFLDYDVSRIFTAGSVEHAIDLCMQSKIDGFGFGLVIIDIDMPGINGYKLVDELYYRNYNTEILLMRSEFTLLKPHAGYTGTLEIVPGSPFVSGVLKKPFHSAKLVETLKNLDFGAFLKQGH